MKRVSSILFAFSIFGGVAYADDFTEINATLTYDSELLVTEAGAAEVLDGLEAQAKKLCRRVSMVSVGLTVDTVCAEDILFQAVEHISSPELTAQYASSDYFVETTSARLQLASK